MVTGAKPNRTPIPVHDSMIRCRRWWGILIWAAMLWISCRSGEPPFKSGEIARLGDEIITIHELRMAYELDPSFPSIRKGCDGLRDYLEEMMDKRLAYKQAKADRLFDESSFNRYCENQIRRSVVQDYYQTQVAQKIEIRDDELRRAFRLSQIRFRLRSLMVKGTPPTNRDGSNPSVSGRIENLSLSAVDTFSREYELDGWELEDFQAGADRLFGLESGQFLGPFPIEGGYRYLQLLDRKETMMATESDYIKRKEGLERKVRRRKEEIEADIFLRKHLEPMDIRVKRRALELVFERIVGESRNGSASRSLGETGERLTDDELRRLHADLKNALEIPLLTSREMNWSIDSFIQYLDRLPQEQRPGIESLTRFTNDLGGLIRDEIVYRMARRESNRWRHVADSLSEPIRMQWAYQFYRFQAYRDFAIPTEIETYYQTRHHMDPKTDKMPADILPGMNHPDIYRWYYSGKRLHRDLTVGCGHPVVHYQDSLLEEEVGRIQWERPVRMVLTRR